jgi:quinol monooxygenase YgiN
MRTIYLVKAEVKPEAEQAWDEWNTRHHVPEVLAEPGFVRAAKYRVEGGTAADGWISYWILYETESREALEAYLTGPAVQRLRADQSARFGSAVRLSRTILLPVAEVEAPRG